MAKAPMPLQRKLIHLKAPKGDDYTNQRVSKDTPPRISIGWPIESSPRHGHESSMSSG